MKLLRRISTWWKGIGATVMSYSSRLEKDQRKLIERLAAVGLEPPALTQRNAAIEDVGKTVRFWTEHGWRYGKLQSIGRKYGIVGYGDAEIPMPRHEIMKDVL